MATKKTYKMPGFLLDEDNQQQQAVSKPFAQWTELPDFLANPKDLSRYQSKVAPTTPAVQTVTKTPDVDVVAGAGYDRSKLYKLPDSYVPNANDRNVSKLDDGYYRPRQFGDNILEAWDNSVTAQSLKSGLYGFAKDLTNLPKFIFQGLENRQQEDQQRQEEFMQKAGLRDNTIWNPNDIKQDTLYKPIIDTLQANMDKAEAQRQKIQENLAKKNLSTGQQIYSQALEAIPEVLGSAFAGSLTDGGSLVAEVPEIMGKWGKILEVGREIKKMLPFGTIAFSGYQQEAEKEGANYNEQALYGLTGATAEVASEFILMPSWLKKMLKTSGATDLIQNGIDKMSGAYGRTAVTFLADMGKEAVQEMAVDPITALAKRGIYAPNTPIIDYSQISQDGLTGGAMSAIMGAFGLRGEYNSHKEAIEMMDKYQKTGEPPTVEDQQKLIKDFNADIESATKNDDLTKMSDERMTEVQKDVEKVIDGLDISGININNVYDEIKDTINAPGKRTVSAPVDIEGDPDLMRRVRESLSDVPLDLQPAKYQPGQAQSLWQRVKSEMNYHPEGLVLDNIPDIGANKPVAELTPQKDVTAQTLPQTPAEAKIEAPGQAENVIGQVAEAPAKVEEVKAPKIEPIKAPKAEEAPAEPGKVTMKGEESKQKLLKVKEEMDTRVKNTDSVINAFKNSDKQNTLVEIKKTLTNVINDMMVKDPGGLKTTQGTNLWDDLLKDSFIDKKVNKLYDDMEKEAKPVDEKPKSYWGKKEETPVEEKPKLEPVTEENKAPEAPKNKYDYEGWNGAAEAKKADMSKLVTIDKLNKGDIVAPENNGHLGRIFTVQKINPDSVTMESYEHDSDFVNYTHKEEKRRKHKWQVLTRDDLIAEHKDKIQYHEQTIKNRGTYKYWEDSLKWHRDRLNELEKGKPIDKEAEKNYDESKKDEKPAKAPEAKEETKKPVLEPIKEKPGKKKVEKPAEVKRGRAGNTAYRKWGNNEYVNADLENQEDPYTKAWTKFFNWWYQRGLEGKQPAYTEHPDIGDYHFAPFLETEAFNAGKKDAVKSNKEEKPAEIKPVEEKPAEAKAPSFRDTPFYKYNNAIVTALDDDIEKALDVIKALNTNAPDSWRGNLIKERRIKQIINGVVENPEKTEQIFNIITGEESVKDGEVPTDTNRDNVQEAPAGVQPEAVPGVEGERDTGAEDIRNPGEGEGADSGIGRPGDEPGPGMGDNQGADISQPGKTRRPVRQSKPKGNDYLITTQDDVIKEKGAKTRYNQNVEAIKLMRQIEAEQRPATAEEQKILAQYVGWGGIPQAFTKDSTWNRETKTYDYHGVKGWEKEYEELKNLLSPEEYRLANDTILNAHYTSIPVIKGMYEGLEHFGFTGGNVLEPAVGIGNFIGSMPPEMRAKVGTFTGVEIDPITARIAKLLYPNADIRIQGFEKAKLPGNFYDVAISNVPFGKIEINDAKYPKTITRAIHNYFFAKALDTVRPGGLVMFVTSSKTLDSKDTAGIRAFMNKSADFIGAVRLPNTAFKDNANTEVITDILVLRKKVEGQEFTGEPFMEMDTATDMIPEGSDYYWQRYDQQINEYFKQHPENILGTINIGKDNYGDIGLVVKGDDRNLNEAITKAMKKMKGDIITPAEKPIKKLQDESDTAERKQANEKTKEGSYELVDGKLYVNVEGNLEPADLDPREAEKIKGLVSIRMKARELLNMEQTRQEQGKIDKARKELNKLYDKFVKDYGYINKPTNLKSIIDDPEVYFLMALENYDKKTKTATKNDNIFVTGITGYQPITSVETGKEALVVSLNETGIVNMERMQKLTGKDEETLQEELKGLIFKNPATGAYEPADQYLSGNVRAKLREAEGMASVDESFQHNVEELKKVQPTDKKPHEVSVKLGSGLISDDIYQQFTKNLFGSSSDLVVNQNAVTGEYNVYEANKKSRYSIKKATSNVATWGIDKRGFTAVELIEKIMNNKSIMVYDTYKEDGKTYKVLNVENTALAQEKAEKLKQAFSDFITTHDNGNLLQQIADNFNEVYNTDVLRQFDGSHLTFPGMNRNIKMADHQKDAVWRVISSGGNSLLAHEVGAGKTFEIIASAMELRRLGLAKKPLIVVPKAVIEQWGTEFRRLYPGAKLLLPGKADFEPKNRKALMNKMALGDFDSIIITEDQFKMIPMSEETVTRFFNKMIDEAEEALLMAKAEAKERGEKESTTEKQLTQRLKNLRTKMEKKIDSIRKDTNNINFEELGIDSLFVDEAHKFKNLMYVTKLQVSGLGNPEGSDKAFDLLMKVRYLQDLNGGRGIAFATATPILNSISEVYNWQQYLQPAELEARGIRSFDKWVSVFGKIEDVVEVKPDGNGYRVKKGFARLTNVGQLVQMFRSFADIKTQDDLKLKRPDVKTGQYIVKSIPASNWLKAYMKEIGDRAVAINEGRVNPEDDNMLKITSDGRKSALDPRLIDPSYEREEDAPSKIDYAVDHLYNLWDETKAERLTHLAFLELSVPKPKSKKAEEGIDEEEFTEDVPDKEAESMYQDIKKRLIEKGVPANEIAFIHDAKTDAQRLDLQDRFNNGDVRILIGNNEKMGVGINLQKRTKSITHIDFPWRPKDLQQEDGRGLRQGNENKEIELYALVTEGSFDARLWDNLQRKSRFIDDLMSADVSLTEVEDVGVQTLSFQEVVGIASGNPLMKEQVDITQKINKLQALEKGYKKRKYEYASKIRDLQNEVQENEVSIEGLQSDLKLRKDFSGDKFAIEIDGKKYTERDKANDYLVDKLSKMLKLFKAERTGKETIKLKFAGIIKELEASKAYVNDMLMLYYKSDNINYYGEFTSTTQDVIQSLENKIRNIEKAISDKQDKVKDNKEKIKGYEKETGKTFEQGDELARLIARQNEIMNELNPPQNVNAGDESEDGEVSKKPGADDEEAASEFSVIDRINEYNRKDFNMEMAEENDTLDQLERIRNSTENKTVQSAIESNVASLKVSLDELKNLREEKIKSLDETPEQAQAEEKKAEIEQLADQIDRITASLNIITPIAENPVTPVSEKRDYRRWITNSNLNAKVTPEEMKEFFRANPQLYEYDVQHNQEILDRANNAVEADFRAVVKYLREKQNLDSAYDSALVMSVAKKLIFEGELNRAQAWQAEMAERMTRLGQAIQILSVWKKFTPEWTLKKVQKDIEDSLTDVEKDKINNNSDILASELNQINQEAVDEVIEKHFDNKDLNDIVEEAYSDPATLKEVEATKPIVPDVETEVKPGEKKKKLEPIKKGKQTFEEQISEKKAQEEASLPEVIGSLMLQKKIERNMEPKLQQRDVLRDMVNTLYEIGKPAMPVFQKQTVTPMEFIKMAMENKELYKSTWERARAMMEAEYEDEPGVLELLDNFFGSFVDKPFADVTLDKAVAKEIRDKKLNLNELIKKNPFAVEQDIEQFVNDAIGEGLSPENAKLLSKYMKRKMEKIVAERRQKKIEGMRKTLDPIIKKPKRTPAQALTELSNLGVFKIESRYVSNKQLDKITRSGIKYAGIDLNKLIKEHYSSYDMAEQNLLTKLTENGINADDAEYVATYIANKFKEITEARKEKALERMFGEKPEKATKKKKEFYQRIIELSNMGIFSKEHYRPYVAKALGITALSNDSAREIAGMANHIQELAPGRERDIAIGIMMDRIASEIPPSFLQRVNTIQTMAQLLNTKTIIRNLGSNIAFTSFDGLSQLLAVPTDVMIAKGLKLFGKTIIPGTGVRKVAAPIPREFWIGFREGLKIGITDAKLGISTTGGIGTAYNLPKRTFRKGILSWFEKGLNMSMSAVDYAVKRGVYRESLAIQSKLANVSEPSQEMIEYATNLANYRTFNDENYLSMAFMGLKKLLNNPIYFMTKKGKPSAWGVGDLLIKYPKTPANLIMRGLEYSPLGLVKTVGEIYKPLRGKKSFDQVAFSMSLTRALMGTTFLYALGALLHHLGILLGGPDDDYDLQQMKQDVGLGAYRINLSALKRFVESGMNPQATKLQQGDTIYSYDWFQPFAFPVVMGANVDEKRGIDKQAGVVSAIMGSLEAGGTTIESQPLIQGLTRFLQTKSISQGVINMLQGVPSSFMPTALNQIKQLVDNQTLETYNPKWELEAFNFAINKVPGLSELFLRNKIDAFGQEKQTYKGGSNNFFNVFLNPGFLTNYSPTREQKAVMDTYEATGETTQIPRAVQPKIQYKNQTFNLDPAQYEDYRRTLGALTKQAYTKYGGKQPNQAMVKQMVSDLNDANEKAKQVILKKMGININTGKRLVPITK